MSERPSRIRARGIIRARFFVPPTGKPRSPEKA